MDQLELQKKRDAVLEALRKLDISYKPREAPVAKSFSGYHRAAAVLSSFELGSIKPIDPTSEGESIEQLMTDSTVISDRRSGQCWSLLPDVRRAVIQEIGSREDLLKALRANPQRPDDDLQRMLEAYLFENASTVESQSLKELTCSLQIVEWLKGIKGFKVPLPVDSDIRSRIETLQLLEPFEKLAGEHFRGRVKELEQLRAYVGVLPPSSLLSGLRSKILSFVSLVEKPPLMIHGPGGMGKSTLVAKFILDHAELPRTLRFPFSYLDFDRPGLLAEEPVTLLIEIVRQLGIQYPDVQEPCNLLRQSWQLALGSAIRQSGSKKTAVSKPGLNRYLKDFRNLLQTMGLEEEAFLLVLDTFEEIQSRSYSSIAGLWEFLEKLQAIAPHLRTVLSGRALLKDFKTESLKLSNLDADAAQGLLTAQGVAPESLVKTIVRFTKGNPLSLRLAVKVFRKEGAASETFFKSLTKERIQGELYTRILGHIDPRDEDVIRLAHPGFVLRRMTPELILNVLAGPCEVKVPDLKRANELFNRLSQEITLVVPAEDGALRHQPEVRVIMLELLREDKLDKIIQIQEGAIAYYQKLDDPISRAEEIYHRLALGQDPEIIAERWIEGVEAYLFNAVEELSPAAQIFLAPRLKITFDESILEDANQADWEFAINRLLSEAWATNDLDKALHLLKQRSTRLPGSPLPLLEAQIYQARGEWGAALEVVNRGIALAHEGANTTSLIPLLLQKSTIHMNIGEFAAARASLDQGLSIARKVNDPMLLVRILEQRLRLHQFLPESSDSAPLRAELSAALREVPDEWLADEPLFVRRLVTVLGKEDKKALLQGLRLIGLEGATSTQKRSLARAIAAWDLEVSGAAGGDSGILARSVAVPPVGSPEDTWKMFLETSSPKSLLDAITLLFTSYDPPEEVCTSLFEILRSPETDEAETRSGAPSEGETAVTGDGTPDLRLSPLQGRTFERALADAFTVQTFASMLLYKLDIRLETLALGQNFANTISLVVDAAQRQGWVGPLINAALESNPTNLSLSAFARELGIAPGLVIDSPEFEKILTSTRSSLDVAVMGTRLRQIEGQVCRIDGVLGNHTIHGTGFLVGADLLFTSAYVVEELINSKTAPEQIIFLFDHKMIDETILNFGTRYRLAPTDWLVSYDGPTKAAPEQEGKKAYLDYVLLRLAGMPGREPIGGDRAEPGAPPRGWIEIKPDVERPAVGELVAVAHHPKGQPLKISFGETVAGKNDKAAVYYQADTEAGSSGAPCFNRNLELIGIHQRRESGLLKSFNAATPLPTILQRLGQEGLGHLVGDSLFDATHLPGGRVFIDRKSFKEKVKDLALGDKSRVLLVNGPRGSGKTYCSEFIFALAEKIPNMRPVSVRVDGSAWSVLDLASAIAQQMGLSLPSMPIQSDELSTRGIQRLVGWIISEATRNSSVTWWFILDGFEQGPSVYLEDFVAGLVVQAQRKVSQLRIVLIGFNETLPLEVNDSVYREELQPLERSDLEAFFAEVSAAKQRVLQAGQITSLVDNIWTQVNRERSTDSSTLSLRSLNRAVYDVLKAFE